MGETVGCPYCGATVNYSTVMSSSLMPDSNTKVHSQEPAVPSGYDEKKTGDLYTVALYQRGESDPWQMFYKRKITCPKGHDFWISGISYEW